MSIERNRLVKGLRLLARQLESSKETHLDRSEYFVALTQVTRELETDRGQRQIQRARPEACAA